jgi:hypothetical protein
MKRKFEVVATVGKWKDPETGKTNKRTVAVGAIYESNGGKLVLRIDAIPVSPDWSGWMSLKPLAPELPPGRRNPPGMPPASDIIPETDEDRDIPF